MGPPRRGPPRGAAAGARERDKMGSALIGSLQVSCFLDRGTFWVLPLTYFHLPKSARAYLFPQSVEIHYFCSGPISVDPVSLQPRSPCGPGPAATWRAAWAPTPRGAQKGANGVSTSGVTAKIMFFDRDFGTPVNLLLYSQKCQGVPFSQSVQNS